MIHVKQCLFVRNCKINFGFVWTVLLFSVSFRNTWPQILFTWKNFRPTPLHNLYTIDQNNFVTLQYLIPTVFLQSWNLPFQITTVQQCCHVVIFRSTATSEMSWSHLNLHFHLICQLFYPNKQVFFNVCRQFHFERFHIYIIRTSVGIDVFIFRIRTDIR